MKNAQKRCMRSSLIFVILTLKAKRCLISYINLTANQGEKHFC